MMRRFNGRMLRTTFGRYPEVPLALARLKAPDVLADMADGQTAGQRRTDLFRVVLDEWLKKDQAKNKSVHQVKVAMYQARPARVRPYARCIYNQARCKQANRQDRRCRQPSGS